MGEATSPPGRVRLSWESRCRVVMRVRIDGMSAARAAAVCGVHRSTVYRLVARFDAGGWQALRDRPPVPRHSPRRLAVERERLVLAVRAHTGFGPRRIAAITGMPASTIGKVLRRHGVSRPPRVPRTVGPRYERPYPGDLIHVDTKRLGRFHQVGKRILADGVQRSRNAGWHHLHVAIDDHTRIAYCEVLAGQDATAVCQSLARAVAWFAERGISCERVMTDNAKAYHSHPWHALCRTLGIERRYTRPYTPRTNGKAERFIQTALREWAYRDSYPTSLHRTRALTGWVRWNNRRRPHGSLGGNPPISRVAQLRGPYS